MHLIEKAPQEDKKIWYLLGGAIAILVLIAVWLLWPHQNKELVNNEEQQLIEDNTQAIQSASFKNSVMPEILATDHVQGNPNAKLGLIIYEDLSQSFSVDLDNSLEQLKKDYPQDLKIAHRSFSASGSFGLQVIQSLDCAFENNLGWEFRREILKISNDHALTEEDLHVAANSVGLDDKKFTTCLKDTGKTMAITRESKEAAKYGVIGAPTIFIGDEMINGARPLTDFVDSSKDKIEGLKTIIDRKLK